MESIWVVYWFDHHCPENEGCYIGASATLKGAEKLGKRYVNRECSRMEPAGEFIVRKVDLDKIRMF